MKPWEGPHALAYPAMSQALSKASGIPHDRIVAEIREVNTEHGTIEYTGLVQSMRSFRNLPAKEKRHFINIAITSRRQALGGPIKAFEDVELLLETFKINEIINIVLSDAPVNLAYMRLNNDTLINLIDLLIGTPSPDDSIFEPQFHMSNKTYKIPIKVTQKKKPYLDLPLLLGKSPEEIRRTHFMYGNSEFSDNGTAKANGLLFYWTKWNKVPPNTHEILREYAPESVLAHNIGTAGTVEQPVHPDYECVIAHTPMDIIKDLRARGHLKA